MKEICGKFEEILNEENKEKAVQYVLELLETNKVNVLNLYADVLGPTLNKLECSLEDKSMCVWKEHVKSGIVRTIVENCYPFVLKMKKEKEIVKGEKAVVICPPEEYHDLGARMAADFFTILGFETIFVGSNTPFQDFLEIVNIIKPKYIAISVSDYYNVVITKKIIGELKSRVDFQIQILVGGNAFKNERENVGKVGADYYVGTFEDIKNIVEKGN